MADPSATTNHERILIPAGCKFFYIKGDKKMKLPKIEDQKKFIEEMKKIEKSKDKKAIKEALKKEFSSDQKKEVKK